MNSDNFGSSNQNPIPTPPLSVPCMSTRCRKTGDDFGPGPYVDNITNATLANPYYRRVLWTGPHLQTTLMCIPPQGEIGLEIHPDLDQFLRLEQGRGKVMMGSARNDLDYQKNVADNYAVFIPAKTWHNVINTGNEPMTLYSIYSQQQHPVGTIQCTKADSDAAAAD